MIAVTNKDNDMRKRNLVNKEKMKSYADNKAYVKPSDFKIGDSILVKNAGISKAQLRMTLIIITMFRPLAEGWMQWSSILGGVVPV